MAEAQQVVLVEGDIAQQVALIEVQLVQGIPGPLGPVGPAGPVGPQGPPGVVGPDSITAVEIAPGAIVADLGYVPANKAGDVFGGNVTAPNYLVTGFPVKLTGNAGGGIFYASATDYLAGFTGAGGYWVFHDGTELFSVKKGSGDVAAKGKVTAGAGLAATGNITATGNIIAGGATATGDFTVRSGLSAGTGFAADNYDLAYIMVNGFKRVTMYGTNAQGILHANAGGWVVENKLAVSNVAAGVTAYFDVNTTATPVPRVQSYFGGLEVWNNTAKTFSIDGSGNVTAPNLPNAYAEGTWTPVYKIGGAVQPMNASEGRYTRIGRQVSIEGRAYMANPTGAAGNVTIEGFPFSGGFAPGTAVALTSQEYGWQAQGIGAPVMGSLIGTVLSLYHASAGGTVAHMTEANVRGGMLYLFSFSYSL